MKRTILPFFILLALPLLATAQSHGSYFFENSLLRSKLNAAFAPQVTYISVPVLGSVGVDAASNVGLKNFIFQYRGKSYTFLNENIPAETFFQQLPSRDPYLAERIETDLIGGGMRWGEHGYATVSLSVVECGQALVPDALLRFAKTGRSGDAKAWEAGGLQARLYGYTSLAAGYSHDLSSLVDGLHVGGRVKLLVGLAAADVAVDRLSVQIDDERFAVSTHGGGRLSGIDYTADGFKLKGFGLRGIGAAIDLGVEYQLPLDGFFNGVNLSASVNDLGLIGFNRTLQTLTTDRSFSFSGFNDLGGEGLQEQIDQLTRDLDQLTRFDVEAGKAFTQLLTPSIYAGAEVPFLHNLLHAGVLYYYTVGRSNLMASLGATPFDWLNLGFNWTFLGPASRFGFYAEFIPRKYVGVFFGMERASLKRNNVHLGVGNFTDSFAFGVNILFGNYSFVK